MLKKTLSILFILALFGVCILAYINMKRQSAFEQHNVFNFVGNNAALYVRVNNPIRLCSDNNENSEFLGQIFDNSPFIASLIQNIIPDIADTSFVASNNSIYVLSAIYVNDDNSFDIVHFIPLRKDTNIDHIAKKITDTATLNKNILLYELNDSKFYIHNLGDLIAVSSSFAALNNNFEQINSNQTLAQDALFTDAISSAGRYTDANIFINPLHFHNIINGMLNAKIDEKNSSFIKNIARWLILDVNITKNLCNLSGFIYVNNQNFLNLLNTQQKSELQTLKSLSPETLFAYTMQTGNTDSLLNAYNTFFSNTESNYFDKLTQMSDSLYVDIVPFIKALYPEEITLTYNTSQGWLTLIKVVNEENAATELSKLEKISSFTEIIPEVFGNFFAINKGKEVSIVNDFIVIAKNKISTINNKGILSINSDYIVDASITALYANTNGISKFFNVERKKNKDFFKTIFVEIIPSNKKFYLNANIAFESSNVQKQTAKANTDNTTQNVIDAIEKISPVNPISEKTKIILRHTIENNIDKQKYTLTQYNDNTIELTNANARLLWQKSIDEKIESNIFVLNPLNKGIAYLLFNTENKIFMIDLSGKFMSGFPITLPSAATNSVAAFAYDKSLDYRIFIACTNKKIYVYNIKGDKVNGWREPKTQGLVQRPIEFLRMDGKDYLVAVDNDKIYVFNRKGYDRTVVKTKVQIPVNAEFEKLYRPARLRVQEKSGKQATINLINGKVTRK